jgi:uncharacterized protein
MKHKIDPEGQRLPIKIDATSNGEFVPVPLSPANLAGNRLAHEAASVNAKRLGLSRRDFLVSACGAASTLLSFNAANAAARKLGGFFDIESAAALEPQLAQARVGGKGEFIFDVQGHFVDPTGGVGEDSARRCIQVVAQSGLQAWRQVRPSQLSQLSRTRGIRQRRVSR